MNSEFYARPATTVAQSLLGAEISFQGVSGLIFETEAYRGADDPASHAYRGPTPRSEIMFGPPGRIYVYLIYGLHHCLNIVTEPEMSASAVLIRGVKVSCGKILDGPGKVCRSFNITRQQNNLLVNTSRSLFIKVSDHIPLFDSYSRIGIKVGTDKLWRYRLKSLDIL